MSSESPQELRERTHENKCGIAGRKVSDYIEQGTVRAETSLPDKGDLIGDGEKIIVYLHNNPGQLYG